MTYPSNVGEISEALAEITAMRLAHHLSRRIWHDRKPHDGRTCRADGCLYARYRRFRRINGRAGGGWRMLDWYADQLFQRRDPQDIDSEAPWALRPDYSAMGCLWLLKDLAQFLGITLRGLYSGMQQGLCPALAVIRAADQDRSPAAGTTA